MNKLRHFFHSQPANYGARMFFWALALCASAASIGITSAVAAPVMIISSGSNNCERFNRAPLREKQTYLVWTEGYISGVNTRSVGDQRMIGLFWKQSANSAWLQDYCSKNPQQSFVSAVELLRATLGGRKP